jgi:hypothetical protein
LYRYTPDVLLSPPVQLALAAHCAYHDNNVIAFFRIVRNATYLQACVLHKYFSKIRSRALETMNATFGKQALPMDEIARLLHTGVDEAEALALHHGLTVGGGDGPSTEHTGANGAARQTSLVVGLYNLNPVDPQLEGAWFHPLNL